MLCAIVGFEIQVNSIQGKFKGSQNRAVGDREGVRSALQREIEPTTELTEVINDPPAP
jgi:predicted FMN-binding regulatory protein PaiB